MPRDGYPFKRITLDYQADHSICLNSVLNKIDYKNSILVIKAGSFTESLFNTALLIRTLYCLHKATNNWRNGKNNWHLSKLNIIL